MEVDGVVHAELAVGVFMSVGEEAVGDLDDHLAGLGCSVEEYELQCRMEDEVGARFSPAPDAVFCHLGAAVVGGADLALAGGVDAGDPLEALGGDHGTLDLFGAAEVELQGLAEYVEAVLVGVEFVVLGFGEAVREHVVGVDGFEGSKVGALELIGVGAHEGEAGPPVEVVGVVGEAAAEFTVGDLTVVDPPVDLVFEHAEIFDLEEGPLGYSGGCGGQGEGWLWLLGVFFGPVLAAEVVGGIDAEEVGDIGVEAVVEVKLAGVDGLFRHVGVVVADLGEAVGDVFGEGFVVGFEDEAEMRAFEGFGAELRAGGGDGDVEALEVGKDAVAGIEPEGVGLAGFDGEVEVEHVAHGPDGIFDLDVHGDGVAMGGFEIESGKIDGDAVEAGVQDFASCRCCRGRCRTGSRRGSRRG